MTKFLRFLLTPWIRIKELEYERDNWRHQATLAADRYEKLHEMNVALRDTLELYRNS